MTNFILGSKNANSGLSVYESRLIQLLMDAKSGTYIKTDLGQDEFFPYFLSPLRNKKGGPKMTADGNKTKIRLRRCAVRVSLEVPSCRNIPLRACSLTAANSLKRGG